MNRYKLAVLATLMAASASGWAQTDAKAALVKQLLEVQRRIVAEDQHRFQVIRSLDLHGDFTECGGNGCALAQRSAERLRQEF